MAESHRIHPALYADYTAALGELDEAPSPTDMIVRAAYQGALKVHRVLLDDLAAYELSAPVDELREADQDEWWQLEAWLRQAEQQGVVLRALMERPDEIARDSRSLAYARHRQAVEAATGVTVPHIALVICEFPREPDYELGGFVPPSAGTPWAVVLTEPLRDDDSLNGVLVHELVHVTQPVTPTPSHEDKEHEWLVGMATRTLVEGATESITCAILGCEHRDVYRVEMATLAVLAEHVGLSVLELSHRISASDDPLSTALDLSGDDEETFLWECLFVNCEERERLGLDPDEPAISPAGTAAA